jgi:hypothetical protein
MEPDDRSITPVEAALCGLAAGLTATLLISALSRTGSVREYAEHSSWRDRADPSSEADADVSTPISPVAALVQASGPGTEGPAGLFAAKIASGLFGRDLAGRTRQWGQVVHLAYGSFWGFVYGILQTRRTRRPAIAGAAHGLFVWAFGPALLVPAMKILPAPSKASRAQTTFSIVAHVIYGITVAAVFSRLIRRGLPHVEPPALHVRDGHRMQLPGRD